MSLLLVSVPGGGGRAIRIRSSDPDVGVALARRSRERQGTLADMPATQRELDVSEGDASLLVAR
jgi:hypothetical protein